MTRVLKNQDERKLKEKICHVSRTNMRVGGGGVLLAFEEHNMY
jgi:hypothetical protein